MPRLPRPTLIRHAITLAASLTIPMTIAMSAVAATNPVPAYPETRKGDVAEVQFGEKIADPYRWLENDVRSDKDVADWVKRQSAVTETYLASLPSHAWFARRIRELMDYERFGLPQKAGTRYFYTRNSGLQNQAQLLVRKGLDGKPVLLLDPNTWAKDGATALDAWVPSHDGRTLAYSVQDGGSDWRTIRVLDVRTGKPLADEIKWAKFTEIAWVGNSGFLYSRFPEPEAGAAFQSLNTHQTVYFHRIGTAQAADELVYSTPDQPELGHSAQVTYDNRWALITTAKGTDSKYELHVISLAGGRHKWTAQPLVTGLNFDWRLIEGMGDALYFITNKDAPRLRVVRMDLRRPAAEALSPVIAERAETLERAQIVGNRLILSYLKDAASTAEVVSLDGKPVQEITLSAIGTASGFSGRPGDPETFYSFSSFNQPSAIFRFDSQTGKTDPFALPKLAFNPADYLV
ncbi:MAG: S9 family peptidase, partial [Novosphingobium sp.]